MVSFFPGSLGHLFAQGRVAGRCSLRGVQGLCADFADMVHPHQGAGQLLFLGTQGGMSFVHRAGTGLRCPRGGKQGAQGRIGRVQ